MKKIKILMVVPNMHRAGLETLIMNIYRHIDREKFTFDFLTHYSKRFDYDDEIETLGGTIHRLTVREDNNFPKYFRDLDEFFKNHKEYRIVHGHMESFGRFYNKYARKHGVPTIIAHSHCCSTERTVKGFTKGVLNRGWKTAATHLFACSKAAGAFMFGRRDFTVINNGIICEDFEFSSEARDAYRAKLGLAGKTVIGHIGRFEWQKNHNFLLKIFAGYAALDSNAHLLLVGTGSLLGEVKALARELCISDKITFLGVREDIPQLFCAMDAFVLPSWFEGLPVVGVEAQAGGLPFFMSTNVTDETCITDLAERIPLDAGAAYWAREIHEKLRENTENNRKSYAKLVKSAGYDIRDVAKSLCEFYESRANM